MLSLSHRMWGLFYILCGPYKILQELAVVPLEIMIFHAIHTITKVDRTS